MKWLSLFALICITFSCSQKIEHKAENYTDLSFLGVNDTLFLSFRNEKCGEWGGDSQNIAVYKEFKEGKANILLDMNERKMNCDSIEKYIDQPINISFEKKRIKSEAHELKLISEAIQELINLQMHFDAEHIASNSGCFSGFRLSNKKFHLQLYPSPKWTKFNQLFKILKSDNSKSTPEKKAN